MLKNKELLRSLIVVVVFWSLFFTVFQSGNIAIFDPLSWLPFPLAMGMIVFWVRVCIPYVNRKKDAIDLNWLSRLNNNFISENMSALQPFLPIQPLSATIQSELILNSLPPELNFNPIQYCQNNLKGVYLELFNEILKTLLHPDNQCGAHFEKIDHLELLQNEIQRLQKLLLVANSSHRPTIKLEIERLSRQEFRRNHDNRSLLTHTLLVLGAVIYIRTFGDDPLKNPIFLRKKIEIGNDIYDQHDPMILICALAHDLGKISAFKTDSQSLENHAKQGQQIVSRLPSYLDQRLTVEDRFILDNVLSHYHAPDQACVGHRIEQNQRTIVYSLSNRMHRALEIVIAGDTLGGSLESSASTKRTTHSSNQAFFIDTLEDEDWRRLISDPTLTNPKEFTPQISTDLSELAQEVVLMFHEIICEPDSYINPKNSDLSTGLGFYQNDIETLLPVLFIKADAMIGLLKARLGELPSNALEFVMTTLAENEAITTPFQKVSKYKTTWAWFVELYPYDQMVRKTQHQQYVLNGEYLRTKPKPTATVGPMFLVNLQFAPEQYDLRFKGYGKKPWGQYGLIVKGLGSGATSAWDKFSDQLLQDRELIIQGDSVPNKTDPLIDEFANTKRVVATAKKKPPNKTPQEQALWVDDFSPKNKSPGEKQEQDPSIRSTLDIGSTVRDLIASGKLGRGVQADKKTLNESGIFLSDLKRLNGMDRRHYGFELNGDQIKVIRK